MGFVLTPRASHPFGTANHLIQFEDSFLELVGIENQEQITEHAGKNFSFGAFNRDYLSHAEGISMIALKSDGWSEDRRRMAAAGLDLADPFGFSRKAKQPNGEIKTVSFKLTFVGNEDGLRLKFFTCDHQHQRNLFFKKKFQSHKNKAFRFDELILGAKEPDDHLDFFRRLFKGAKIKKTLSGITIYSEKEKYSILSRSALLKRFPGIRISDSDKHLIGIGYCVLVTDLSVTKRILRSKNIEFREKGNRIWLEPNNNFGVIIEFVAETF